jgi:pimeloyl-ACP methyl ester carboxylesterase/cell wall-associated NlpC family hydrolase
MAVIEVNGARLYYEAFGQDQAGRAPVVLIHGSTSTGRSNWSLAAPLLARRYRVIVPDCRGHGQSENPNHSYSFKEMAADTAALVRRLGYERAHIIGHSNGGNVALVALLEHPDVVQSAVLQAANAYVSPDLVEKEPAVFDPQRVRRDDPGWMNEMILLHGATHGPEYWSELLRLTLEETITQPNYTPQELAAVQRPALVVQGEEDWVNAPAGHARFIAHHIPHAELWIPAGVGHNVHDERLFQWVERVEDFLERRGDPANDQLYRLKRERGADDRVLLFSLHLSQGEGGALLAGQVLRPEDREAALERLRPLVGEVDDQVQVLLDAQAPWALVRRSVNDLRREPTIHAACDSQALIGEAVRILQRRGDWAMVQLLDTGYLGWLQAAALHECSEDEARAYQAACCCQVAVDLAAAYASPRACDAGGIHETVAGRLPFGARLVLEDERPPLSRLRLPDGRFWWVESSQLAPLQPWRVEEAAERIQAALDILHSFVGVPYLWGGRTPFGFDCSGFAQAFWGFLGVRIPRDADQQFLAGRVVEGAPQPGDLLFFGDQRPLIPGVSLKDHGGRRITHVGVSLGGSEVLHSNAAAWGVSYNSLDPASPIYSASLRERLAGVRRYG